MTLAAVFTLAAALAPQETRAPQAGERGGPGLALFTAKALTAAWRGPQVIDNATLLVRDGRIEALGARDELAVPAGYVVRDLGPLWVMPGMIDLHSHAGGTLDINDLVYVTQPELSARTSVLPANPAFQRGLAAGVTAVLFIPGSGSNCGGTGVLLKTGPENYEDALLRDPGSLKVAQWGNPEDFAFGVGKTWENYHLRHMFREGRAYAQAWTAHESGSAPQPQRRLELEVFRDLFAKRTQVSTHTQVTQVVMMTLLMIRGEFGLDVYIDHGEFGGHRMAALAEQMGVPAILGPRNVETMNRGMINFTGEAPERFQGIAAGYQELGHSMIGFNTDSLPFPGFTPSLEDLPTQAALAVYYGFDDSEMSTVRGMTIVPAKTAGLDHRIGSLEPGKDADLVVLHGSPADPRCAVEAVYVEGRKLYDTSNDRRRW
jgi:imidazolonepropionase-like amidohydrolase